MTTLNSIRWHKEVDKILALKAKEKQKIGIKAENEETDNERLTV